MNNSFMFDKSNSRFISIIISISIFLFSLGSYYFYQVNLYVFQIVGMALLLPFFKLSAMKSQYVKVLKLVVFVMYIFFVSSLSSLFYGSDTFGLSKLAFPLLVFLYFSFAVVIFKIYPEAFQRALTYTILVHVFFFMFQFLWFLTTFEMIDFLQPFTGEVQRALGGSYSLTNLSNFIRPTGLYNEPGTYSTWMILLLLLLKSHSSELGLKAPSFAFEMLVITTALFSFSTFGFIFSLVYMISHVMEKKISKKTFFALIVVVAFFINFGYEYFISRFSLSDDLSGVGIRSHIIQIYLDRSDLFSVLFGFGIFNNIFTKIDADLISQDLGLWFSLLSGVGVVGILLLASVIVDTKKTNYNISIFIILMLSKLSLTNALVWVVFIYFLVSGMRPNLKYKFV
jgi:hypothetical protein